MWEAMPFQLWDSGMGGTGTFSPSRGNPHPFPTPLTSPCVGSKALHPTRLSRQVPLFVGSRFPGRKCPGATQTPRRREGYFAAWFSEGTCGVNACTRQIRCLHGGFVPVCPCTDPCQGQARQGGHPRVPTECALDPDNKKLPEVKHGQKGHAGAAGGGQSLANPREGRCVL